IQDLDQTPLSRQYADAFRSSITFRVISWPVGESPERALTSGRARGALIIPEHFARDVLRGRNAEAQLLVDATDTNTALITQGNGRWGDGRVRQGPRDSAGGRERARARSRRRGDGEGEHTALFHPRARPPQVLRPGHVRTGALDLPAAAGDARHVARGRAAD